MPSTTSDAPGLTARSLHGFAKDAPILNTKLYVERERRPAPHPLRGNLAPIEARTSAPRPTSRPTAMLHATLYIEYERRPAPIRGPDVDFRYRHSHDRHHQLQARHARRRALSRGTRAVRPWTATSGRCEIFLAGPRPTVAAESCGASQSPSPA